MSKSRFVFDKFAKFLEEGLVNYKDFSDEVVNILRSKKEEIILKMNLVSKDEIDILNKRIEKLEKKIAVKPVRFCKSIIYSRIEIGGAGNRMDSFSKRVSRVPWPASLNTNSSLMTIVVLGVQHVWLFAQLMLSNSKNI